MVSSRRSRPLRLAASPSRLLSILPLFLFRSLKCDSSIDAVTELLREQPPASTGASYPWCVKPTDPRVSAASCVDCPRR